MKDYYQILEIHPDASLEVMNNAYRALVRKYHPDLYHTSDKSRMEGRMREINEAYNVLSNTNSRAEYDRRYTKRQNKRPAASAIPSQAVRTQWRNMLLWGIGTFILLRFLVQPLLASPVLRLMLLFGAIVLLIRVFSRSRRP
jgi:curved DNA-binding protein CbpA